MVKRLLLLCLLIQGIGMAVFGQLSNAQILFNGSDVGASYTMCSGPLVLSSGITTGTKYNWQRTSYVGGVKVTKTVTTLSATCPFTKDTLTPLHLVKVGVYVYNGALPTHYDTLLLTINDVPPTKQTIPTTTICSGSSLSAISAVQDSLPLATYQWYRVDKSNVTTTVSGNMNRLFYTVTSADSGCSFYCKVTYTATGCQSFTNQFKILVNSLPTTAFTAVIDTAQTCLGTPFSQSFIIGGTLSGYSYQLVNRSTLQFHGSAVTSTGGNVSLSVTQSGNYVVYVTSPMGCSAYVKKN